MKKKSAPAGIIVVLLLAAWMIKSHQPTATQSAAPADAGPGQITLTQPGVEFPREEVGGERQTGKSRSRDNARETPQHFQREEEASNGPREISPYQVTGVRIVDIHTGRTMPIHTVDLRPTVERIAAGEKNAHRNDGTVFRNSGHKLPKKPSGYYREYVVPTDGVRGPGPQRLVIGKEGEIYYTFDHYETFVRIHGDR